MSKICAQLVRNLKVVSKCKDTWDPTYLVSSAFFFIGIVEFIRGHSQTTFTAMGEGGVHQMSTLLNKYGKFYLVKLSTRGEGGSKKAKNL